MSYITEVRNGPKGISEYNLEKLNKTISQINPQALGFLISQEEGNDITS